MGRGSGNSVPRRTSDGYLTLVYRVGELRDPDHPEDRVLTFYYYTWRDENDQVVAGPWESVLPAYSWQAGYETAVARYAASGSRSPASR